jgi:hypothetical protein
VKHLTDFFAGKALLIKGAYYRKNDGMKIIIGVFVSEME